MLTKRSWHVFLLVLLALAAFTLPTVGLAGSVSSPGYLVPTASSTIQVETLGYAGGAGYQDLRARNLISGTGALNTGATNGFAYTQAGAGAPVGTPGVLPTGSPPLYVDSTNARIYAYYGAAWNSLGGSTPTLGQVVNAGNVVNSVAASGQITWTNGGTYDAVTTPNMVGPSAGNFFISAGNGQNNITITGGTGALTGSATLAGGNGTTGSGASAVVTGGTSAGVDTAGSNTILNPGYSTGLGIPGSIVFRTVPKGSTSGSSLNSNTTNLTIQGNQNNTSGTDSIFNAVATFTDNNVASSGTHRFLYLNPTYNYTNAAKTSINADLQIDRVETSLSTGAQNFILCRAGVAGTTLEFSVGNGGTITTTSGAFITSAAAGFGFYQSNGATSQNVSVGTLFVGTTYSHTPPTGGILTDAGYGFHSAGVDTTSKALLAYQGSAGVIGLLNPNALTTSCEFDVFNTADAANLAQTNSEALAIKWATNVCQVGTVKTGTGTVRTLALQTGGTSALTIDVNQTIKTAAAGTLAQGFTTGGLILPLCATGAPSGAATNGNIVVGADNNLWCRINGAWVQVNGGATPTLGSVVNAGNVVNSVAVSGQFTWTTGGTYAAGSTSQIYGPTDTGLFVSAGSVISGGASNGQALTLTGGTRWDGSVTQALGASLAVNGGTSSKGGGITLSGGGVTVTNSTDTGGAVSINGGDSSGTTTTGDGGGIVSKGGKGGTTSGTGGTVSYTGGAGQGSTSGAGGLASLTGGAGSTVSNNNNAGGCTLDTGASTGTGTAQLLFNVPIKAASGASANTTATVLTIDTAGCVYVGRQNVTQVSAISFTAGQGGSTSGAGGGASLIGGAAGTAGGASGVVTITGGANAIASGSTAGGAVNITGGACSGTTSTGAGGAFVAAGGLGGTTSGTGGAASITGGAGQGSTSGVGGLASMTGGAGSTGSNNNNAGGCTISTGAPTGTGTANVNIQTGFTRASAATAQTMGDRFYIAGHNVTMSNTSATAIAVAILNIPTSNSSGGCMVVYQISANDGTNWNTATGSFTVSCSNKAGTVTATTAVITDESSNVNSGTLSAGAVTATVASQAVSIKLAPTFTVIVPTTVLATVTIIPFGNGVTVSAQ